MRVSTRFPIAVHAMVLLAVFTGDAGVPEAYRGQFAPRRVTSEFIAGSTGSNAVIIRGVLGSLKRAGLISVAPGKGGTTLALPPDVISLWDIYAAVEETDTDAIFKFHAHMSDRCPVGSNIRRLLSGHFDSAVAAMRAELATVSLQTLVEEFFEKMAEHAAD